MSLASLYKRKPRLDTSPWRGMTSLAAPFTLRQNQGGRPMSSQRTLPENECRSAGVKRAAASTLVFALLSACGGAAGGGGSGTVVVPTPTPVATPTPPPTPTPTPSPMKTLSL